MQKYFGYRRRYVQFILEQAPRRAALAVASELARLAFMFTGNVLCALILWVLTAAAAGRSGGLSVAAFFFGALALLPTAFAGLAAGGIANACADRRRVQRSASAAAEGSRS